MSDSEEITQKSIDALVRKAQKGSPEAVGALYDQYQERIFRYIWVRVQNYPLAEDLTGEVFMRMVQQLDSYQLRGIPFQAWLYRIARNLVIDTVRKNGRYPTVDLENIAEIPDIETNPATLVESSLTIGRLVLALGQIDPTQAEVIRLRFALGFSLKETADTLEKTIPAVKAYQHRGLNALREILEPEEEILEL